LEILGGRNHFGDLDKDVRMWTGLNWLRIETLDAQCGWTVRFEFFIAGSFYREHNRSREALYRMLLWQRKTEEQLSDWL
jgi:hypothetical protein